MYVEQGLLLQFNLMMLRRDQNLYEIAVGSSIEFVGSACR
jgi:hypothetical protein